MRRPLRFRRNMVNYLRWGWQGGITGSSYGQLTLVRRHRHQLAFNIGKFFGKRWNF